jgi:predicted  nucleic acid-binding Zn-ribbon protein
MKRIHTAKMLNDITEELERARNKFPTNDHKLTAMNEEVGELNKAMLEHERGLVTAEEVYEEAVQVAAMAIRVGIEGDSTFNYKNPRL